MSQPSDTRRRVASVALVFVVASCAMQTPTSTGGATAAPSTVLAPKATGGPPAGSPTGTSSTIVQDVYVPVELTADTLDRAHTWQRSFMVGYGNDADHVGLSPGGDEDAVVLYGPETAAPVTPDMWWVVDSANHRVALFDEAGMVVEASVDQGLQFIEVTATGDVIAHTRPDPILIMMADGSSGSVGSATPFEHRLGGGVSEEGNLIIPGGCGTRRGRVHLVALPDGSGNSLVSGFEALCGPDDTIHVLWFGYWENPNGEQTGFSTYVQLRRDGSITTEAMGQLRSSHDPGTPRRLHLVPATGAPALSVIGEDGVEGWIREA